MCRAKAAISPIRRSHRNDGAGQDRHEELAEPLAVVVEVLGPEVHLQVADHVDEDEAHQHDPGDRHDVLLADGRPVELDGERGLALGPGAGRGGPRATVVVAIAADACTARPPQRATNPGLTCPFGYRVRRPMMVVR